MWSRQAPTTVSDSGVAVSLRTETIRSVQSSLSGGSGGSASGDDDDDGHQQPSGDRDRQEQEEPQSEAEEEAEQEQIERLNCINIFYKYTQSNIDSNTETKAISLFLKSGIEVVKVVSGKLWILGILIYIVKISA